MNKAKLENKFFIVDALNAIDEGKGPSYYLQREIEKRGFITPVFEKTTEGRGRPKKSYKISGKGRGYLALAKRWKREDTSAEA